MNTPLIIAGIVVIGFFIWVFFKMPVKTLEQVEEDAQEREAEYSNDYHRQHGAYRVLYDDGYISQPMLPYTAKSYAERNGGRLVERNYNGPHRILPGGGWVNVRLNPRGEYWFQMSEQQSPICITKDMLAIRVIDKDIYANR